MASAVSKALSVIRLLRRTATPLTLTEIARSVSIAPSTAHSLLNELVAQGVVVHDSGRRYRLGPATFYFGASYARNVPIYRSVWRDLVDLSRSLSLTGVIATPWEGHHLILNVHDAGSIAVEVAFGGRVPIDAGAWGRAYFAWNGASLPTDLTAYTPKTITDPAAYEAEVVASRERGFAIDREEFIEGAGAVATAVTSNSGFEGLIAVVGSLGDFDALDANEVGRRLAAVAARASYSLGDDSRVRVVGDD